MMDGNLTDKQRMFCEEYLIDLNATQAAIRAGYSKNTADRNSVKMLRIPKINEYIQLLKKERKERIHLDADYVVESLKEISEVCRQKVPIKDKDGNVIGFGNYNPLGATKPLELIGKHLGIFIEKHEVKTDMGLMRTISSVAAKCEEERQSEDD